MNEMQDTRPVWRPRRPSGMADTQPVWRQPPDDDELPEGLELGEPTCRGYGPVDPLPAPVDDSHGTNAVSSSTNVIQVRRWSW